MFHSTLIHLLDSTLFIVALLMACSWMMELLPLPITSLIPLALFPLMGIMNTGDVSVNYLNKTCMLFVGGRLMLYKYNLTSYPNFKLHQICFWKLENQNIAYSLWSNLQAVYMYWMYHILVHYHKPTWSPLSLFVKLLVLCFT